MRVLLDVIYQPARVVFLSGVVFCYFLSHHIAVYHIMSKVACVVQKFCGLAAFCHYLTNVTNHLLSVGV
jgi:hypothetical protein